MREIKAYLHAHRIADVIRALRDSGQLERTGMLGVTTLSVALVQGLLPALDAHEKRYSVDLAQEVIDEAKLELVCEDDQVDAIVAIIAAAAETGQERAGWIYVAEVLRTVPLGRSA